MRKFLLTLLIVIYSPTEKTSQIKVYEITKRESSIDIVCAEGVSYSECQGNDSPKEKESVSYDEIVNFVMQGSYDF